MAHKKGDLFSGAIGPVVFKIVNGRQIICARPGKGKVKLSDSTKKAGKTFGMAATIGARIRRTINQQLANKCDKTSSSRLSGELFSILHKCRNIDTMEFEYKDDSFKSLEGFEFNSNSKVKTQITSMPVAELVNGMLKVNFGQIKVYDQLKFPSGSYHCLLTATVSLLNLKANAISVRAESLEKSINVTEKTVQPFTFEFTVPNGCLYLLCLYQQYTASTKDQVKAGGITKLNRACILKVAISPGTYDGTDTFVWEEILQR
jgi:hypothetical protein